MQQIQVKKLSPEQTEKPEIQNGKELELIWSLDRTQNSEPLPKFMQVRIRKKNS